MISPTVTYGVCTKSNPTSDTSRSFPYSWTVSMLKYHATSFFHPIKGTVTSTDIFSRIPVPISTFTAPWYSYLKNPIQFGSDVSILIIWLVSVIVYSISCPYSSSIWNVVPIRHPDNFSFANLWFKYAGIPAPIIEETAINKTSILAIIHSTSSRTLIIFFSAFLKTILAVCVVLWFCSTVNTIYWFVLPVVITNRSPVCICLVPAIFLPSNWTPLVLFRSCTYQIQFSL